MECYFGSWLYGSGNVGENPNQRMVLFSTDRIDLRINWFQLCAKLNPRNWCKMVQCGTKDLSNHYWKHGQPYVGDSIICYSSFLHRRRIRWLDSSSSRYPILLDYILNNRHNLFYPKCHPHEKQSTFPSKLFSKSGSCLIQSFFWLAYEKPKLSQTLVFIWFLLWIHNRSNPKQFHPPQLTWFFQCLNNSADNFVCYRLCRRKLGPRETGRQNEEIQVSLSHWCHNGKSYYRSWAFDLCFHWWIYALGISC